MAKGRLGEVAIEANHPNGADGDKVTELRVYQPESTIQETWRPLAVHADGCDICLPWVAKLARDGSLPEGELCPIGQSLLKGWLDVIDSPHAGT